MRDFSSLCLLGIVAAATLTNLAGCGAGSNGSQTTSLAEPNGASLAISGSPPTSVTAGAGYKFQPSVTAPSGANLSFSIARLPSWATFDHSTGALTGLPAATDAGEFAGIVISVADGTSTAALAPFTIAVASGSSAVATVSWTAADSGAGTAESAGYVLYYGTSAAGMTHVITVADPVETTYVVQNLSPGTWYFAVASYSQDNVQSSLSPTVAVTL
jgi:hypothetical protein